MAQSFRLPAAVAALVSAFLAFAALPVFSANSSAPEDFVKDKGAPPAAGTKPAAPAPAKSAKAGKSAQVPAMDTTKIHDQYLEGDFDQAIRALEAQIKTQRPMSHAESLFVFKHLGVMYAAQPTTREKGKHYMQALIAIEPTAKILDMYASDMIHLIFRNVQEEYEAKRQQLMPHTVAGSSAGPAPDSTPPPPPPQEKTASTPKDSGRKKTLFLAAAGASVAVGALTLFLVLGDDEPKTRTIEVSE